MPSTGKLICDFFHKLCKNIIGSGGNICIMRKNDYKKA
jgi:hypothetical protein